MEAIKNHIEHQNALRRLEEIFNSVNEEESKEADELATAILKYEDEHYHID